MAQSSSPSQSPGQSQSQTPSQQTPNSPSPSGKGNSADAKAYDIGQGACEDAGHPLELRLHDGYDHSYHFIATFMPDHLKPPAQALC